MRDITIFISFYIASAITCQIPIKNFPSMCLTRSLFGLVLLLFGNVLVLSVAQDCDSKVTCDQCIQEVNCFWCTSSNNTKSHCYPLTALNSCPEPYRENPKQEYQVLQQRDLSESQQVSPQRIRLKLKRNEKFEIKFKYRQSANYPVDLYYLMDLSHSMEPFKNKLSQLGKALAEEMRIKTNNFQIGFGSFIDKLTLPYVNTHPEALKSPCQGCASPYNFKNHLSLTQNDQLFAQKVKETQMSGNLDTPEAGLDAIMQAMVCKNEIGWRPNARHLLVISTDAPSHIAGDGKLGGVIEPNDAKCYLVNDTYTEGLVYDYPSVSQINYIARQNNINIIFAIVKKSNNNYLIDHYKGMSEAIDNSKMGTVSENLDVVKFISQIYDEIRNTVRITSNAPQDINVNITSQCSGFVDGECFNVKPSQVLEFTATIQPLTCYKNASLNKRIINIKPEALTDSLTIELEVACDCECSQKKQSGHPQCNGQGVMECGICKCNEGRFGANCQCDSTESKGEDPSLCIRPGGKNDICSGQGKCICGMCHCKTRPDESEHIYGKYCECDDFSCPLKCSGRGTCDCGKCYCDKGWTGVGCECSTDTSQCFAPGSTEICSGHGKCVCGQCVCTQDRERHSGKYCEDCTSCPAQRCDELKACVECQAYQTGLYAINTSCTENCREFNTTIVSELKENSREGVKTCRVVVEKDCTIVFQYSYDESKNLIVEAEKSKICPVLPNTIAWIIGVIASVLLAGIIALIAWKVVTTIHDKNEYAKFEAERNQMKWSSAQNPLYKPGTSHFVNPAYKRASKRSSTMGSSNKTEKMENANEESVQNNQDV